MEAFLDSTNPLQILCFTEHWCKDNEVISIEGFSAVSSFSRSDTTHGGSCIFSQDSVRFEEEKDIKNLSIENHVECSSAFNRELKLIVICIYRPPNGNFNLFTEVLTNILDTCTRKYNTFKIILCGDFNVDFSIDSMTKKLFLDVTASYDLMPTIDSYTRVVGRSKSIIDNIFVNFHDEIPYSSEVVATALSDHFGQVIAIGRSENESKNQNQCKYAEIVSDKKLFALKQELMRETWHEVMNASDANGACNIFLHRFSTLSRAIFSRKCLRSTRKPWITQGIKISSMTKRKLYIQKCNGEVPGCLYDDYSRVLKNVVREAKKISNIKYISVSRNKNKAVWNLINKYTGRNKKQNTTSFLEDLRIPRETPLDTLNRVNNFLVNQCEDTAIVDESLVNKYQSALVRNPNSLFLSPADCVEVKTTIKQLQNTNSSGDDKVSVKVLKYVANEIVEPLTHVINLIIGTGDFPEALKISEIRPIFKSGDKGIVSNYRPVAILSNISKIVEKIIHNRLINFFDHHQLLSDYQNGFRKGRSTTRAAYQALTQIIQSKNKSQETLLMSLDLSKAFDRVEHDTLIKKLECCGIRGVCLRLFETYLKNRRQAVVEYNAQGEKIKSDYLDIRRGVPQGSILGPLLYLIYTNDLQTVTNKTMIQYADDTSLVFSGSSMNEVRMEAWNILGALEKWFVANSLSLNSNKTTFVRFDYKKNSNVDAVVTNNNPVNFNFNLHTSVKFLGIYIDHRLDWSVHVNKVSATLASYCYAVRQISLLVGIESALTAYHALAESGIRYGIVIWGNSSEVQRILILQKKLLRGIFKLNSRESCRPYFREKRILTVFGLYVYEAVMFILKNPALFVAEIQNHHNYNTRNKNNLKSEKLNFTYLQKNCTYILVKIHNKIPPSILRLPLRILQVKLKKFLIAKSYYSLEEFLNDEIDF